MRHEVMSHVFIISHILINNKCIYSNVYIYIYVYIHMKLCIYIYMYIYICRYIYICICVYIYNYYTVCLITCFSLSSFLIESHGSSAIKKHKPTSQSQCRPGRELGTSRAVPRVAQILMVWGRDALMLWVTTCDRSLCCDLAFYKLKSIIIFTHTHIIYIYILKENVLLIMICMSTKS